MKTITSILLIFSLAFSLHAQKETPTTEELQEGTKELQEQVQTLMNFYQKYEEKTSDKDKKQAYDKVVHKLDTEGEATEKDKEDAFKVIDAYIKADQAPSQPQPKSEEVELKDHPEIKQQAQEQFDTALNHLMAMSYDEYEAHVWQASPMSTRREVKESYNNLHKDDDRSVSISAADDEPTETQRQVNAYNQIENAKTYTEYRDAVKILMPNLSEEEIREAWEKR